MRRVFTADALNRVWFPDIPPSTARGGDHTQYRASDGWVYCCAVINVYSLRMVGCSIAGHIRTELAVNAPEMARCQRRPAPDTVLLADRGSRYTS